MWSTIALLLLLFGPIPWSMGSQVGSPIKQRRELIVANHGVVATDDGRCSKIGRNVLREGGNAVDASVAATFCLGVVSPASSGIGGGAFMVLRSSNGMAQAFDMREVAPLLASENMYGNNSALKTKGALSVAVPAQVAGLREAWKQHGKLPWKRLVSPAAKLARQGFKIAPYLHFQMVQTKQGILADKGLSGIFTSNGSLLKLGDICHNMKLAETLEAISMYGPDPFYNGSVGVKLVKDVQEAGGILTMKDLKSYRVKVTEPIASEFMGHKILTMPPPSSGGVGMILMLNILSQYKIPTGISGSLGLHRTIEAIKHMIAVRMNLGDPDFVDVSEVVNDMLSLKFAQVLKAEIFDNMTFSPSHYGGKWNQIVDHGTSHLSIVDSERNAVSMTTTINAYFGSQFLSPATGIVLNNEMDDFSIPAKASADTPPPAPPNFIRPSKRPLSSMTPTIVLKDGQLKAVIGASGGGMIIAGTTEVFLNYFARKMDPFSSVMAPRSYHQLIPNKVRFENWTAVSGDHYEVPFMMREALQKKGHILESLYGGTICQFVVHNLEHSKAATNVTYGELTAVSDPRKGGFPAGF